MGSVIVHLEGCKAVSARRRSRKAEEDVRDEAIDDDDQDEAEESDVFAGLERDIEVGQVGDGAEKDAGERAEHHPCVKADDDERSKALDGVVIKASLEDKFFCDIADGSGETECGKNEQEEEGGEAREAACESLVLGDASDIKAGFGKPENAERTAKNDGDHREFDGAVMEVAAVGSEEKRHPKGKKGEVLVEGKGAQGVLGEGDQGEVKGVEQKDDEQDLAQRLEQME